MLGAFLGNPRIPATFLRTPDTSPVEIFMPAVWAQRIPARRPAGGQKSWQGLSGGKVSRMKILFTSLTLSADSSHVDMNIDTVVRAIHDLFPFVTGFTSRFRVYGGPDREDLTL